MSEYTPPPQYPWTTGPPNFDSDTEKTKDISGVPECSGITNPKPYQLSYPEHYWDKRYIPLLYEKITAPNRVFNEAMVNQLEIKPTKIIQTPIYSENG